MLPGTIMVENLNTILNLIDKKLKAHAIDEVSINRVLRRVLAEDLYAPYDVPSVPKAKKDGFAFCLLTESNYPLELRVVGQSLPGSECELQVSGDEAVKVYSGSHLPGNCTAVVAEKDVQENDSRISITQKISSAINIHAPGEIVRKGELLMRKGRFIRSGDIGLLALSGVEHLKIFRSPKIGLINVGSELREIYENLLPGETRNASQYLLKAKLEKIGFSPLFLSTVYDDFDEMKKVFSRALRKCDVLITTGGSSLSKNDLTKKVWDSLGVEFILDSVEMSPGRNTGIGVYKNKKYIFTLAGNPVSAAIMFDFIVNPGLMKVIGRDPLHPNIQEAVLESVLKNSRWPVKILPGFLRREGRVNYVKPTAVDLTRSMLGLAAANCYILLKKSKYSYNINDVVEIIPWRDF